MSDRERELQREALLWTAVGLFNDKGFHATSLDDIAEALNVPRPTIDRYFASKDEILLECLRRGIESIRAAGVVVAKQGGSGLAQLKTHMRRYAVVVTRDFGRCVMRTAEHDLSDSGRARFRALKREIDLALRAVVERGMTDGSVAQGNVRLMTFTLAGALNWIAHWYDPKGPLSGEEIAEGFVATLVNGLAPRRTPEGRVKAPPAHPSRRDTMRSPPPSAGPRGPRGKTGAALPSQARRISR